MNQPIIPNHKPRTSSKQPNKHIVIKPVPLIKILNKPTFPVQYRKVSCHLFVINSFIMQVSQNCPITDQVFMMWLQLVLLQLDLPDTVDCCFVDEKQYRRRHFTNTMLYVANCLFRSFFCFIPITFQVLPVTFKGTCGFYVFSIAKTNQPWPITFI